MTPHKIAFVIASTAHGVMIVNRFDQNHRQLTEEEGAGILLFGVGAELLEEAQYSSTEIITGLRMLDIMKRTRADRFPLQIVDVGANIGTHAISWGDFVRGWGEVHAYEPQRLVYYALCGNIAINNLDNVYAHRIAIGRSVGELVIPNINYFRPSSFGSLELVPSMHEDIGQPVSYEEGDTPEEKLDALKRTVPLTYLRQRIDLFKIDAEGMELDVIIGAASVIERDRPVIITEALKADSHAMKDQLEGMGYVITPFGRQDWLCIHNEDPILVELRERQGVAI